MYETDKPLIPASQKLPEITVKAIIIALFITVILTASNAYLALKVGTTIAASIPASILAMGILRFFKRHNVLESNIVQTAASAGEAVVGAISFTLPALLIMHFWTDFHYWEIVLIIIFGGTLGVCFSVPLRQILLADKTLAFPEGRAIGNVLRTVSAGKSGLKNLLWGGGVGGALAFCQSGLEVIADHWDVWWGKASTTIYGFGIGFSPALLAAGFIVGIRVTIALAVGVVIGWLAGIPILSHIVTVPSDVTSATDKAMWIWMHEVRYIGVGTMLVGGIWLLLTMLKSIVSGITKSFQAVKLAQREGHAAIARTERDIPINYTLWLVAAVMVPVYIYLFMLIQPDILGLTLLSHILVAVVLAIFVLFLGFLISSICGYFAGLIGSTNSPLSGMVLITLISGSFVLMLLFIDHHQTAAQLMQMAALAVVLSALVATAGSISNDTIQDLKAGQMVGATPWKQQVMLIVGVVTSAFVTPLILNLLFYAYGIGNVFPHAGMNAAQALSAPQATLVQSVVMGVFSHDLNWPMVYVGMIIAVLAIIVDEFIKRYNQRLPVLAIGLGIYLPIEVTVPMMVGGVISALVNRKAKQWERKNEPQKAHDAYERSVLLACGIVAGASLMGVILAIPFVIYQSSDALSIMPAKFMWLAVLLGMASTVYLAWWLYHVAVKGKN